MTNILHLLVQWLVIHCLAILFAWFALSVVIAWIATRLFRGSR